MNVFDIKIHSVAANEYMGFGLSGSTTVTLMRGADPTITYVDDDTGPVAIDYYLSEYVQVRIQWKHTSLLSRQRRYACKCLYAHFNSIFIKIVVNFVTKGGTFGNPAISMSPRMCLQIWKQVQEFD